MHEGTSTNLSTNLCRALILKQSLKPSKCYCFCDESTALLHSNIPKNSIHPAGHGNKQAYKLAEYQLWKCSDILIFCRLPFSHCQGLCLSFCSHAGCCSGLYHWDCFGRRSICRSVRCKQPPKVYVNYRDMPQLAFCCANTINQKPD